MNDVNWWLMALAFLAGLVLTFAWMIRRIALEVPVLQAAGVRGSAVSGGAVSGDVDDRRTARSVTTNRVAAPDVWRSKMPAAGAAAAGAAAAARVAPSRFTGASESTTAKIPSVDAPYGAGSARVVAGASAPKGYTIKGNEDSMLYHSPESPDYPVTVAEVWFRNVETAEAAGFSRWDSGKTQHWHK